MKHADAGAPILVAGLARSGTTWLAKLLDSHPDTLYRHEPDTLPDFPDMPLLAGPEAVPIYGRHLADFAAGLPALNRVGQAGSLPVFRKRGEGALRFQHRRLATSLTRLASRRLGNIRIAGSPPVPHRGPARLLWKSVLLTGRLGCLLEAVERLQVVLLIRHPCGIIESRARGVGGGDMAPVAAAEFAELGRRGSGLAADLLRQHCFNETFELEALRWAVLNSAALDALSDRPGCAVLRYEDLCADPSAVLRDLLSTLQLAWDPQLERFLRTSTERSSARFYGLHRRRAELDPWRRTLPDSLRKRVAEIVEETPAGSLYEDMASAWP